MKPPEITPVPGVSRETQERLVLYYALLLKWQDKINLISPGTIPDAWTRHFVDSAQIAPLVVGADSLYDLGSGAGFPGMVLAIVNPALSVTLIESDAKKCAFLQTVSRETGVAVTIRNERIERAATLLPAPNVVVARALASLSDLLEYAVPWIESAPNLRLIFPKGAGYATEVDAARAAGWAFDLTERPSITDKNARILCLENVRKSTA